MRLLRLVPLAVVIGRRARECLHPQSVVAPGPEADRDGANHQINANIQPALSICLTS